MKKPAKSTRSGLVEKWRSRPIPSKLWHYTSIAGFHGIVTSKKIFATDVRFLNDKEEFTLAAKLVREFIEEAPKSDADVYSIKGNILESLFSETFESGIFSANDFDVFVASFSEAEDELSQWRGYSHGSSGVSLGLALQHLRLGPKHSRAFDRFNIDFAPCIYEEQAKRDFIRETLSHYTQDLEQILRGARTGVWDKQQEAIFKMANSYTEAAGTTLFRLSALLKNSAFAEEREWRLVVPIKRSMQLEQYPRRFRTANTQLIPYIEYPLCFGEALLPLNDVILGPGSEITTAAISAESLLQSQELTITPRESKVPFKPW